MNDKKYLEENKSVHLDLNLQNYVFFSSKMVPIALNLYSSDGAIFRVIFKIGDDLRQYSLILQIFKIWIKYSEKFGFKIINI